MDKTIDMLLESIGFDESEVRASEKEFILMRKHKTELGDEQCYRS